MSRQTIAHLAQLDFLAEAKNIVFEGPPATGKTHLSIALGVQTAPAAVSPRRRHAARVGEPPGAGKRSGRRDEEPTGCRGSRCSLGYIPFDPEAAALFFALVSSARRAGAR